MTRPRWLFAATAAAAVGLAALFCWASGGIQQPHAFTGEVATTGRANLMRPQPTVLRVATWNIAFGYGGGSDGSDFEPRDADAYDRRLQQIAQVLMMLDADVVLLQEVDFDSARSHHIDQLRTLAEAAGYHHVAYARSWRAGYVPFPYWPPAAQFGAMDSGGGVLSRYPIAGNHVALLPKPDAQPWWYQAFYLFRYSQAVTLNVGDRDVVVRNQHLEAWNRDNRADQARLVATATEKDRTQTPWIVVGGDFNSVPATAITKHGFPDSPRDDYRDDPTLGIVAEAGLVEAASGVSAPPEAFWTFPAAAPNRRLDYVFATTALTPVDARVVRTGELSDHLPVVATFVFAATAPAP